MNRQDSLSQRISEIRDQLYGEFGLETLARALEVPEQTWRQLRAGRNNARSHLAQVPRYYWQ